MATAAPAGIGHNLPPEEKAAAEFDARVAEISAAANEWIKRAPEIRTDDEAQRCRDFLAQLAAEIKAAEDARAKFKAPYLAAADAVQVRFKAIVARCQKGVDLLKPRMNAWLFKLAAEKEAREKEAREAAEKAQAEAAAKAAAAVQAAATGKGDIVGAAVEADEAAAAAEKAQRDARRAEKERPKVAGNYAPRSISLRKTWRAEITDYELALQHFKGTATVKDAVQAAADAAVRAVKDTMPIPGVTVKVTESI